MCCEDPVCFVATTVISSLLLLLCEALIHIMQIFGLSLLPARKQLDVTLLKLMHLVNETDASLVVSHRICVNHKPQASSNVVRKLQCI